MRFRCEHLGWIENAVEQLGEMVSETIDKRERERKNWTCAGLMGW